MTPKVERASEVAQRRRGLGVGFGQLHFMHGERGG
jgi:hypothetical protein